MTEPLPGRTERRRILVVMCFALATVVSAVASLNVALPDLARDTGATQTELQWVIEAYALVFAALLLPGGALGDRFGRRRALLVGLGVFGSASLAAALVSDPDVLIILRGVTGVGAALVMPATLSIITSSFPEDEREQAVAAWAGVAGAGAVLGLLAAGALLEVASWQAVFGLNFGLALVAGVATGIWTRESAEREEASLDPVGAVLSGVALGAVVYSVIEAPERGWTDILTLAGFGVGLVGLAAFIGWELRCARPMLDPRLFVNRRFSGAALSITLQFFAFFGFIFLILQYLQLVQEMRPLTAAVCLLPMSVSLMAAATRGPRLVRHIGVAPAAGLGLGAMAIGLAVLSQLEASSSYWLVLAGLVPLGGGMGLAAVQATSAIVSSLPLAKQGVGSAINDTTREVGGTLGIAVLGSLLNNAYRSGLDTATGALPPQAAETAQHSLGAAVQVAQRARLPELADAARSAFVDGFATSLLVVAIAVAIAAPVVAFLLRGATLERPAGPRGGAPDHPARTRDAKAPPYADHAVSRTLGGV